MSQVPIMVTGVLWDHANKSGRAVTLMGEAHIVGLGVGGGPVLPPDQPAQPPGTPTFPIWGPPGMEPPNKPGYPPVAGHPPPIGPEHPIAWPPPKPDLPPDAGQPPTGPLGMLEWHTMWTPEQGWFVAGVPSDQAPPHVTPSKK